MDEEGQDSWESVDVKEDVKEDVDAADIRFEELGPGDSGSRAAALDVRVFTRNELGLDLSSTRWSRFLVLPTLELVDGILLGSLLGG